MTRKILVTMAILALLAVAGCGQNEEKSSAQKAGDSISKAVESSKEAAQHAADAVKEAADKTAEQAKDVAHDALQATEKTAHEASNSMEKKE